MSVKTVTLIMTGASGAEYGLRLLEELVNAKVKIYLLLSRPAHIVIRSETVLELPVRAKDVQVFFSELYDADDGQIQVFEREQWMAPIASGSGVADATVVCPCTTGSLSAIAMGSSKNLLERACDVAIKESKPLILVVRETPFSAIHLENMLKLARIGVTIMPANPGFYYKPDTLDDIIDFMVARILDQLGMEHELMDSWGS